MEFGWAPDSLVTRLAYSETFDVFLQRMVAAWPQGPCSEQLQPYLGECQFVGKLENLRDDLENILDQAGEIYDKTILDLPPINETALMNIKRSAVASRETLEAVMASEKAFATRFGYEDIPQNLIANDTVAPIWPLMPLKAGKDIGRADEALVLGTSRISFDYRFASGALRPKVSLSRREQLAVIESLENVQVAGKRIAVIGNGDPYFAYLLKSRGAEVVDFITFSSELIPESVLDIVDIEINIIEVEKFLASEEIFYDFVLFSTMACLTPTFDVYLCLAASKVAQGGLFIFSCPIVYLPTAVKAAWETAEGVDCFYSYPYLQAVMRASGLSDFQVVSEFSLSPGDLLRPMVFATAKQYDLDPEEILGLALLKLEQTGSEPIEISSTIRNWLVQAPADLTAQPIDRLASPIRATIAKFHNILDYQVQRNRELEAGLSDRDTDLSQARKELVETRIDRDLARERVRQAEISRSTTEETIAKLIAATEQFRAGMADREDDLAATRNELAQTQVDRDLARDQLRQMQTELEKLKDVLHQYDVIDTTVAPPQV